MVGIILPVNGDPEQGYEFATKGDGSLRKIEAFVEPGLKAKHYSQWLWRGSLDEQAPVWLPAMRSKFLHGAYGRIYVEHRGYWKYAPATGGYPPTDCYLLDEA